MSKSIARNTAFITGAYVGQKIISFIYFTLIARHLGVEDTGKYFFAMSFTTIFVVFVDLGFTNVLIREVAKTVEKAQTYLSTIMAVKIFLGVLSYLGAVITINLLGYSLEIKELIYLSAITMIFDSIHLSVYGIMRALGNLKYEAIGIIGSQFISLILGTFFLYTGKPLIYLMVAFVIPSFINVCFSAGMLYKNYQIVLKPKFDVNAFIYLGRIVIPFAAAAVFARLYSYIDSVLLSKLASNAEVGWYSIPYKITFAFQFIPMALVAALYPRFSEAFIYDKSKLSYYFEQGVKYLLIIVLPIAVGIIVLAEKIVLALYTVEYLPSILPLQILMVSLIFSFLSFPIGAFLNACNRQITQTLIILSALVFNIVLNLFLIPKFGTMGAAISASVGNVLITVVGYFFVKNTASISHKEIFKTLFLVSLSALVMGFVVWIIGINYNYLLAILSGAIIYPTMLFATKILSKKQITEAYYLIKK